MGGGVAEPLQAQEMQCRDSLGVSLNEGYHFEGPPNKGHSLLGSMLGSSCSRKLPFRYTCSRLGPDPAEARSNTSSFYRAMV